MSQAGEIPQVGDAILVGPYSFTVTLADERRIEEVHVRTVDNDPNAPLAMIDDARDNSANSSSDQSKDSSSNHSADSVNGHASDQHQSSLVEK